MVICILALATFGLLGIFSAKYRSLAKEAFQCVLRRITFRPCITRLDERIKSKLIAKLMNRAPKLARFTYKNFEFLSWIFVIVFFGSMIVGAYGLYNLFTLGTCDPSSEACPVNLKAPICGCKNICQCEVEICESPEYLACEGDCDCQREVCEMNK